MAKGHRSQIKRERNAQKDTRPSAKLSYARVSVQKACFVLLSVPIHCDRIYIFGKQVVIFLLFEVPLIVHQVVGCAG